MGVAVRAHVRARREVRAIGLGLRCPAGVVGRAALGDDRGAAPVGGRCSRRDRPYGTVRSSVAAVPDLSRLSLCCGCRVVFVERSESARITRFHHGGSSRVRRSGLARSRRSVVAITLCTFNVNNLFVRYRFGDTFPGDQSHKSAVTDPADGYLPMYNQAAFKLFNPTQRDLAAQAITQDGAGYPDIICLQEVESLIALRSFKCPASCRHLRARPAHRLARPAPDRRGHLVAVAHRQCALACR
jgi:hypothetical protein